MNRKPSSSALVSVPQPEILVRAASIPSAEVPDISPMTSREGLFHNCVILCMISFSFSKKALRASSTDRSHRSQV